MSDAESSYTATRYVLAFSVVAGGQEQFIAAWCELAEAAARHPANIEQWLTSGDDGQTWYVTSDWRDADSYHEFSAGAEHHALAGAIRAVTTGATLTRSSHALHLLGSAGPLVRSDR